MEMSIVDKTYSAIETQCEKLKVDFQQFIEQQKNATPQEVVDDIAKFFRDTLDIFMSKTRDRHFDMKELDIVIPVRIDMLVPKGSDTSTIGIRQAKLLVADYVKEGKLEEIDAKVDVVNELKSTA